VIPTLREAVEEVHAALAGVYNLPESCILDHEPYSGQLQTPLAVTCAPGGITATDVLVTVRCYSSVTLQAVETAWDGLNDLVAAVEALLDGTDTPRSAWARPLLLETDSLIFATDVAVPRLDF